MVLYQDRDDLIASTLDHKTVCGFIFAELGPLTFAMYVCRHGLVIFTYSDKGYGGHFAPDYDLTFIVKLIEVLT